MSLQRRQIRFPKNQIQSKEKSVFLVSWSGRVSPVDPHPNGYVQYECKRFVRYGRVAGVCED